MIDVGKMSDVVLGRDAPPELKAKALLAWLVTAQYHGEDEANRAAEEFFKVSDGGEPSIIPEVLIPSGSRKWPRLLVELGFAPSTSQARALIDQGGVTFGPIRVKVLSPDWEVEPADGLIVRVGKRKFVRVRLQP